MIRIINTRTDVLQALKNAHLNQVIEITLRASRPDLIRTLTDMMPYLLMPVDKTVTPMLTCIAQKGDWMRMSRTHKFYLRAKGHNQYLELANVLLICGESIDNLEDDISNQSIIDLVEQNPEVCYDEGCFRQTCEDVGCGTLADEWMLKLEVGEENRSIGWIILKIVPARVPHAHEDFLRQYIKHFYVMIALA